jgi:hypothetical protein
MKWLSRRGLLRCADDAEASNTPPELSRVEALTHAATQRGTLVTVPDREDGTLSAEPALAPPPRVTDAVTHERFNLHASVNLAANDDLGRERLCRYLSRPAFSLSRLRILRDGRVSYRVKKASRGRVTERVMSPVELLARLSAILPPPRYPLLRFHGVLASNHSWRARVVPRPPARRAACKETPPHLRDEPVQSLASPKAHPGLARARESGDGGAIFVLGAVPTCSLTETGAAERVGPNILSVAHWARLRGGELYASSARLDWRALLKRTFECDLRACVRCGGRVTLRAVVTDPASVARFLAALRRQRDPPAAA